MRTFEQYCNNIESVENYEAAKADNFKGWNCHHRLETHNSDGERRSVDITRDKLKELGMYYNRPAEELIFLRTNEHCQLHMRDKKRISTKTRKMNKVAMTKDQQRIWAILYNRGLKGQDSSVEEWIVDYKELQERKLKLIENFTE